MAVDRIAFCWAVCAVRSANVRLQRAGDQLVIWRLDLLGRSLKDLIEPVTGLEQREVELVSLLKRIDTTAPAAPYSRCVA